MPITVAWDEEMIDTLHIRFPQKWQWDDLTQLKRHAARLMAGAPRDVHLIADLREARMLPGGATSKLKNITRHCPANTGLVIIVSSSLSVTVLSDIFKRVMGDANTRNFVFVTSMDEARAYLRKFDSISHGTSTYSPFPISSDPYSG